MNLPPADPSERSGWRWRLAGRRAAGAVGALVCLAALAFAPAGRADHSLDYHWGPRTLGISVHRGPHLADAAEWAAYVWYVQDWPAVYVAAKTHPCDDPPIGVVTVCYAGGHQRTHIHVTVGRDGHALKGVIHISPADADDGALRMRGILCHEIGHALGFGHRPDGDGCMLSANHQYPDQRDYAELQALYGHRPGFDHWHRGRWHIHEQNHCHPYMVVFCRDHVHKERHRHEGHWHRHNS